MVARFLHFTVNGVVTAGPSARITVNGKTDIVAYYIEEKPKMVKVTNETGANMIAVKITLTQTTIPISNGVSVDIPFDPAAGDVEIKLKPAP